MKLPWYIISKPTFGKYTPLLGKYVANSIGPLILIPKDIYQDLETTKPDPKHTALLIHEETHRKRQRQIGLLKYGVQYLFSPRFRFNEELIAVKEGMKYLKSKRIEFDFNQKAKFLSSYLYLWPVSKDSAKKELEKVYNDL